MTDVHMMTASIAGITIVLVLLLAFAPPLRKHAMILIAIAVGLIGIILGSRFRSKIALPMELRAMEEELRHAEDKSRSLAALSEDSRTSSDKARAKANKARDKAKQISEERKAVVAAVMAPTPDDLRARRFMRRWRNRNG